MSHVKWPRKIEMNWKKLIETRNRNRKSNNWEKKIIKNGFVNFVDLIFVMSGHFTKKIKKKNHIALI